MEIRKKLYRKPSIFTVLTIRKHIKQPKTVKNEGKLLFLAYIRKNRGFVIPCLIFLRNITPANIEANLYAETEFINQYFIKIFEKKRSLTGANCPLSFPICCGF